MYGGGGFEGREVDKGDRSHFRVLGDWDDGDLGRCGRLWGVVGVVGCQLQRFVLGFGSFCSSRV